MDAEELRQAFAEVVGFAAFPVLVVIGILAFAAVTLRGNTDNPTSATAWKEP